MDTAQLKKKYKEEIAPALQKQFNYSSAMQIPVLKKIYADPCSEEDCHQPGLG